MGGKTETELKNTVIFIAGGAGSLGRRLIEEMLNPKYEVKTIRVFDNHENGLAQLRVQMNDTRLRWFLGDIRDRDRLIRAMENVDIVINTAAQKHVDLCELNPFESVKTNVIGTQNCIEAALENNVDKFLMISSDKAVQAVNTYGRCKALAESLTIDANNYKGDRRTKLSVIRLPNYLSSDGSVFEIWDYQKTHGLPLTVTSTEMTRFFLDFNEVVTIILKTIDFMKGREIFIPTKIEKHRIIDLAKKISNNIQITGMRPGEKLEELLIDPSELEHAEEVNGMLVIK